MNRTLLQRLVVIALAVSHGLGCSQPYRWRSQGLLKRAKRATTVVFATVIDSPRAIFTPRSRGMYSAQFQVHCTFKGSVLPPRILVSGFGYEPGLCTRSSALKDRSYILFLRNINSSQGRVYRVAEINVQSGTTEANKRHLRKFLRVYGKTAKAPISAIGDKGTIQSCPSLPNLIELLRLSRAKVRKELTSLYKKSSNNSVKGEESKDSPTPKIVENDVQNLANEHRSHSIITKNPSTERNSVLPDNKSKYSVLQYSSNNPTNSAAFQQFSWIVNFLLLFGSVGLLRMVY